MRSGLYESKVFASDTGLKSLPPTLVSSLIQLIAER
jgi:hypothetical protein